MTRPPSRIEPRSAVEAADQIERRGLAGAVGSDDAGDADGLRRRRLYTAFTPPKLTERSSTANGPRSAAAASKDRRTATGVRKTGAHGPRHGAADKPHEAGRREPQNEEQQHADEEQAVLRQPREHLGQQHDHQRADEWTQHTIGAADHDHQQEQDRLEEREGLG